MTFHVSMLAGPVVGAAIGYCTNFIAVKMLFRPLKPVKLGNYTLPFTPGIIPKGKERLARALGKAVGDTLLTREDMENALLTDSVKEQVVGGIITGIISAPSIREASGFVMEAEQYEEARGKLTDLIENKILDAVKEAKLGNIVVEEGIKAIRIKFSSGLIGMLVNDELLASLAEPIRDSIERYIDENGPVMVGRIVEEEAASLENIPMGQMLSELNLEESKLREAVGRVYVTIVEEQIGKIIDQINIARLVEQKINDMDVLEVEKLTLSVMKKELDAVVNLGALIGFIIGMINSFI